eukprot:1183069-Prorocentrum_minimum.AAC.5
MRAIKYTTATWAKRVTVMMLMLMLMMTTTIRGIIEARAPSRPPRRSWRRCRWTWGRRQSPAVGCRRSTWAFLGLAEDLEQLVVGEEVEPREGHPLGPCTAAEQAGKEVYSHDGPIRRRERGYILTTDQSDTGSTGIFSRGGAKLERARLSAAIGHRLTTVLPLLFSHYPKRQQLFNGPMGLLLHTCTRVAHE